MRLTHQHILIYENNARGNELGKSREVVTNTLRLLSLPQDIQNGIYEGKISEGHAKMLAGIKSAQTQKALYDEIIKNNLNVRQIEQRVREVAVKSHYRKIFLDPEIKKYADQLTAHLGYKTDIKRSGVGGTIVVRFAEKDDLEKLTRKIIK